MRIHDSFDDSEVNISSLGTEHVDASASSGSFRVFKSANLTYNSYSKLKISYFYLRKLSKITKIRYYLRNNLDKRKISFLNTALYPDIRWNLQKGKTSEKIATRNLWETLGEFLVRLRTDHGLAYESKKKRWR